MRCCVLRKKDREPIIKKKCVLYCSGWWFQTFFIFHNIWDNPSHWLICFKIVKTTNQCWLYVPLSSYKSGWLDTCRYQTFWFVRSRWTEKYSLVGHDRWNPRLIPSLCYPIFWTCFQIFNFGFNSWLNIPIIPNIYNIYIYTCIPKRLFFLSHFPNDQKNWLYGIYGQIRVVKQMCMWKIIAPFFTPVSKSSARKACSAAKFAAPLTIYWYLAKFSFDILASRYFGQMIFWQNNAFATWYFGNMILWQNNTLAKWYVGKMMLWQNDILATWHFGKMISLDTRWPLSKQTHCSKQTVLQFGSRNSRNLNCRRTYPKVFDLHRKNSSKNIMKQSDPQEPEYLQRSLILTYWYSCAVLFAAPRVVQDWVAFYHHGCRDAGTPPCMNMLWSHALPIRVFHVKTVQPSLNLRFLVMKTMSVDLSIGLSCVISDKRHCLQVLWFEAGSTNSKQTQLSQWLHRHTVPTGKKYRLHLLNWTFSFYIVHLRLTFQTVGVQNPKHNYVQLPCCKRNTSKQ